MNFFGIFGGADTRAEVAQGRTRLLLATGVLSASLMLSGCSSDSKGSGGEAGASGSTPSATQSADKKGETPDADAAAAAAQPAPKVYVSKITTHETQFSREWPAQTKSGESVNVMARVEGTLEAFNFREGMGVKAGQVLFTIDDAPYRADLQAAKAGVSQAVADLDYANAQVNVLKAKADLASAQADLSRAQQDVDRYKPLARNGVIATQTLDNAVAQRDVARAKVEANQATLVNTRLSYKANIEVAKANLESAKAKVTQAELNVGYCVIKSPINGIIGKLNVDPGNLVGQSGNTQPLVTLSRLDPIYVNFSISEVEYLWIMNNRGKGVADYQLLLSDGTTYPYKGKFGMLDRTISSDSGTMGVRIIFPNPTFILREGQFGRLRMTSRNKSQILMVPQRAVITTQSLHSVYVVDKDNVVSSRNVEVGNEFEDYFMVKSGLQAGDRVIVDGLQKVKPGATCDPIEQGDQPVIGAEDKSK